MRGLTCMEDQHICCGEHYNEDEDDSSSEEEDEKDQKPKKRDEVCGPNCYYSAEQQRKSAIEGFPDLDT